MLTRETELSILYEISSIPVRRVDELLDMALDKATRVLGADVAVLYLKDQADAQLRAHAARGTRLSSVLEVMPLATDGGEQSLRTTTWSAAQPYPFAADPLRDAYPVQAALGVPIHTGAQLLGWLYAVHLKRWSFEKIEISLFNILANRMANALEILLSRRQLRESFAQLEEQYQRLAREIAERKRAEAELQTAKDSAESANRAKSTFLATMSHELRTPLNAILGYAQILQLQATTNGYVDIVPDLGRIRTAGNHLLNIISDILDLSKIEAERVELTPDTFEIATLLSDVAATVYPLFEKNQNRLELSYPAAIGDMEADLPKVRQVLLNLLSNAAKFTEHGKVGVEVAREHREEQEWVIFRVSDDGIGISAEQLSRLFQPFAQADASTTRKYGGTGLGLTISQRLCQLMGGDITVASEIGLGSTFTVHLPALSDATPPYTPHVPPPATQDRPGQRPETPAPNGRVLVIDDDYLARDLIAQHLAQEGFLVELASGGQEGLRMAKELAPDVITLDVLMPELDGWSVLAALKADAATADIPIIMLTMMEEARQGFALGASEYLTKPIQREKLIPLLSYYCRQRAAMDAEEHGHVLIVDDDATTRAMVQRMLAVDGYRLSEAGDGLVALDRLRVEQPDLILLDLIMPKMDGFELLSVLRATPRWEHTPIVVITAMDLTDDDRLRLIDRVEQILHKGAYTQEELLRDIRRLVGASLRRRQS